MKKFILLIIILLFAFSASAASLYVTDSFEITLRSGEGLEHKILGMIPSGEQVEVLEVGDRWSKVKRKNGREGYVLTRFLQEEPPNFAKMESLKKKYDSLSAQFEKNNTELKELRNENSELKKELSGLTAKYNDLKQNHEKLKKESGEYLSLKKKYEENADVLKQKKEKADELQNKLMERNIKLFVAGAVVLLIGFIAGMSARKKQKRIYY